MKKNLRPRLPLYFGKYLNRIKSLSEKELSDIFGGGSGDRIKKEETGSSVTFEYEGKVQLTSKEEAIQFFGVDLDEWKIDKYIANNWAGNTQIKLFLSRIDKDTEDLRDDWMDLFEKYTKGHKTFQNRNIDGQGEGVFGMADFHFGANIKNLIRTPDFNLDILIGYFQQIAQDINNRKYEKVHLIFAGDIIESFTGLNHMGTFKELDSWGVDAITTAYEVIERYFLQEINNLTSVNIVSGNHDRTTIKKELDYEGGAAKMFAYLLRKTSDVEVRYNPMILSFQVGAINYVVTHGHHYLSKKDVGKILYEYGEKGYYNVLIEGHLHSRLVEKAYKAKKVEFEQVTVVDFDSLDYRKVILPPLFTGNFYSESMGFSSSAGYMEFWEQNGKLQVRDAMI